MLTMVKALRFFKEWILPPAWANIGRRLTARRNRDSTIDQRRYWDGEPLESPLFNVPLFTQANLKAASISFQNETRDCMKLDAGGTVTLRLPSEQRPGHWKIAFGTSAARSVGSLIIESNGALVSELTHIPGQKWNAVRLSGDKVGGELRFLNETNTTLNISHPVHEVTFDPAVHSVQNVIVVVLDSLWRDAVGLYREVPSPSPTPNIDRFFENAIVYRNCYSIAEWTLPSVRSMLTSTYPVTHGHTDMRGHLPEVSGQGQGSLAERMVGLDFSTMACSTAKAFTPGFNGHIGFQRFFYDPYPESGRTSLAITYRAIDHLEGNRDGRNFLFLHCIDTHEWWDSASLSENCKLDPMRIVGEQAEYELLRTGFGDTKAEPIFDFSAVETLNKRMEVRVQEVDLHFQALWNYLDTTGLVKTSMIVLMSDHGFQYLSRGAPLLCETRVHVPFLIRHPNYGRQVVDDLINQGLDFAPTLVHLAGSEMNTAVGKVVAPFSPDVGRDFVLSESVFADKYKISVRTKDYVYHLHSKYDKLSKTIRIDEVIESFLFATHHELPSENLICLKPDVALEMRQRVIDHLKSDAREIAWVQTGAQSKLNRKS